MHGGISERAATIRPDMEQGDYDRLVEATARRYHMAGRFDQGFIRGKLRNDPVYAYVLQQQILPQQGLLLDLGCGRGMLLALLATARQMGIDAIGKDLLLAGIEQRSREAATAKLALSNDAKIDPGDIREAELPTCTGILLIDVLLYLHADEQQDLLRRIAAVLGRNTVFIIREADAGSGLSFHLTWLAERWCALARGHWRQRYHYRRQQEWRGLLESLGFAVTTVPMSNGTPFANVLYIARR